MSKSLFPALVENLCCMDTEPNSNQRNQPFFVVLSERPQGWKYCGVSRQRLWRQRELLSVLALTLETSSTACRSFWKMGIWKITLQDPFNKII